MNMVKFIATMIKPSCDYLKLWVTKRPVQNQEHFIDFSIPKEGTPGYLAMTTS